MASATSAAVQLTLADGVRILPRLVILAVVFTAPHYIRPAGEKGGERWR